MNRYNGEGIEDKYEEAKSEKIKRIYTMGCCEVSLNKQAVEVRKSELIVVSCQLIKISEINGKYYL